MGFLVNNFKMGEWNTEKYESSADNSDCELNSVWEWEGEEKLNKQSIGGALRWNWRMEL